MTCRVAKRNVKKASRILSKFPNSDYLRKKYFSIKKSYTKLIKQCKNKHFRDLTRNIENGKAFNWKEFNNLKRSKNTSETEFDAFDLENFEEFFKNLYSDSHNTITQSQKDELIAEADNINEITSRRESDNNPSPDDPEESIINENITLDELNICIKQLKNGKASSIDLINNEILKNLNSPFRNLLLKLYNHCFETGTYPWDTSIITPLHKKGDIRDPDNYRAIAVGSCVGKLYSTILLNRLIEFRSMNCPDPLNQLGFTKNAQTADHLFTLSTLANKYKSKKRAVYSVFVDFRKAFDSICRQALFYKLSTSGITGKFYNTLRNMYSTSKAHIKLSGHLSGEIPILKGTEQGHPLSPDLFKIFFKDLSPLLNFENCPSLMQTSISHLLWADDLVILALDPVTLQNQLNKLNEYCKHWGVDINMDKTKLLIFNGPKSVTNKFSAQIETININDIKLKRVDSYCYLGIEITSTGSFKVALKDLKIKAMRALISMKRTIDKTAISFKACCTIFDALIKPVILYASPIWAMSLAASKFIGRDPNWVNNLNSTSMSLDLKLAAETIEKVHLKFIKWALGVHRKASNIGVWGESGRMPLLYNCIESSLKYYNRLQNLNDNSLVSLAFKEQHSSNLAWKTNILNIIKNNTNNTLMGNVYTCNNINTTQPEVNLNPNSIKHIMINLTDKFINCWNLRKSLSPKLSYYNSVKTEFKRESYLADSKNFKARSLLTKLRISAHDLNIETGRYTNTPRDERTCEWCKIVLSTNIVEDELHFLLHCDLYNSHRQTIIANNHTLNSSITQVINNVPVTQAFIPAENNKNYNILLCKLVCKFFDTREKFLDSNKNAGSSQN